MRWSIELDVEALESPTLKDDLAKLLAEQLPPTDAAPEKQPPREMLDSMAALLGQATHLASLHQFKGSGVVLLKADDGKTPIVSVSSHETDTVSAANLDPREVAKIVNARAAAAKAASRKVVKTPGPVKTTAAATPKQPTPPTSPRSTPTTKTTPPPAPKQLGGSSPTGGFRGR